MRYVVTGAARGIGREVVRRLPPDGVITELVLRPWHRPAVVS